MKRHINLLHSLLATLFICASCAEQDIMQYEENAAIYFVNQNASLSDPIEQHDSINHSFFTYPTSVTRDTVHVVVRIMGTPVDYERPIKLVQTNIGEPDAAIAGTHFVALDDPALADSLCVHAGEVNCFVPIVLLRDASLASQEVRLELTLEANEYFRPGIDKWRNFLIKINDTASKPTNWDTFWKYHFGISWGPEKMRFIIQYTGLTDFTTEPSDYGYLLYISGIAKQALLDYNAAHPDDPLCEADGTPVSFDN